METQRGSIPSFTWEATRGSLGQSQPQVLGPALISLTEQIPTQHEPGSCNPVGHPLENYPLRVTLALPQAPGPRCSHTEGKIGVTALCGNICPQKWGSRARPLAKGGPTQKIFHSRGEKNPAPGNTLENNLDRRRHRGRWCFHPPVRGDERTDKQPLGLSDTRRANIRETNTGHSNAVSRGPPQEGGVAITHRAANKDQQIVIGRQCTY